MCGSIFKAPEVKLPPPAALPAPAAPRADPLVSPEADGASSRTSTGMTRRKLKTSLAIGDGGGVGLTGAPAASTVGIRG